MWAWKWFGTAICDTIYIIYLSLFTQQTDPNPFRGTHCTNSLYVNAVILGRIILFETKGIYRYQTVQVYRQIDRQVDRQIDRQIDILMYIQIYTQIDRQIKRQMYISIYRQIDRQIDRQKDRQMSRYIDRQIARQIDRLIVCQIDRQTKGIYRYQTAQLAPEPMNKQDFLQLR